MKITVIGGGSSYTPELMEGLLKSAKNGSLDVNKVTLMDINKERLEIITPLCKRMADKEKLENLIIESTTKLEEAIPGSDFVLVQLRVGGNSARHKDILLGHRHRIIGQETTGIGGFAKALRTIPVIKDIVDEIKKSAPNAWLIDFTNPVSLVTQYFSDYCPDLNWIGLCNYPYNVENSIAEQLKVEDKSRIFVDYLGLNHLSFVRGVNLDGKDVTKKVLDGYLEMNKMANLPSEDFSTMLIKSINMIPNPYLLYYYNTVDVLKHKMEAKVTRAQEVEKVEKELFEIYKNPDLDKKPEALEKRGGAYYSTVAINLVKSIANNKKDIHIVNTINRGAISNLPDNASIEVPCIIDSAGAHPLNCGKLPDTVSTLVQSVKNYEIFGAKAAAEKKYEFAYLALLNHPLVTDSIVAEKALDDLLETNKEFISGFKKG